MKTSITINQVLSCNTTNRLKRIALVCLAFVMAGRAFPCAIPGTHNYYLFSVLQPQDWQDRVYQQTLDNWQAYANGEKMDWFDADVLRTVAKKKSDVLMVHYLDHLTAYLNVVQEAKASWEYPSKLEVQQYQKELERIRDYALSNTNGTLRSQHALLYMRCNMMLEQHQENIRFWEQKASKYIRSVYREMMRNIYAGALLKTGKVDAATAIYAEQGDVSSLYTYYYKKRSYEAIKTNTKLILILHRSRSCCRTLPTMLRRPMMHSAMKKTGRVNCSFVISRRRNANRCANLPIGWCAKGKTKIPYCGSH